MATAHNPGDPILAHIGKRLQKNCTKLTKGRWHCQLCGTVVTEDATHKMLSEKEANQLSYDHSKTTHCFPPVKEGPMLKIIEIHS